MASDSISEFLSCEYRPLGLFLIKYNHDKRKTHFLPIFNFIINKLIFFPLSFSGYKMDRMKEEILPYIDFNCFFIRMYVDLLRKSLKTVNLRLISRILNRLWKTS